MSEIVIFEADDSREVDVRMINEHITNVLDEGELERDATVRKFRIVRQT